MYNFSRSAKLFMEVMLMNTALITQLKIIRLSNLKPNFSELSRQYNCDRRTVKKYYYGYEGKPAHRSKRSRLDRHVELVNKGQKSFSEALEELIELEQKNNQLRAENACVKTANFPFIKTLDDFDFDFQPAINRKELLELNSLSFIEKKENILFIGSSGVGKTHLATAIGITCARARYSTYFISFESLMNQLKKSLVENRLEARMKFFAKYKVLVIDEIGYMPIDKDSANLVFQLIARRYEKHCTIITTNMVFSKWGEIFGSPTLANAVLDRLLHYSQVISIKGPSYRLKDKRLFMEVQADK